MSTDAEVGDHLRRIPSADFTSGMLADRAHTGVLPAAAADPLDALTRAFEPGAS